MDLLNSVGKINCELSGKTQRPPTIEKIDVGNKF